MLTHFILYKKGNAIPDIVSYDDLEGNLELNFEELAEKFREDNGIKKSEAVKFADGLIRKDDGILCISNDEDRCHQLQEIGLAVAGLTDGCGKDSAFEGIRYVIEGLDSLWPKDFDHIYRRLKGLPCEILQTERLLVRETTIEDLAELRKLYSDPEITRYIEDLYPEEEEIDYQKKYIENIYGFYEVGIWSLFLKSQNNDMADGRSLDKASAECQGKKLTLIGRMGLEIKEEGNAELGYMLGREFQGKGYATEAGLAIIDYARSLDGIEKITAKVHKDNIPSQDLCERLGMLPADQKDDMIIYEMLDYN